MTPNNIYEQAIRSCIELVEKSIQGFPTPTNTYAWYTQNQNQWADWHPRLITQVSTAWNETLNSAVHWIRSLTTDARTRATSDQKLRQRLTEEGGDALKNFAAAAQAHALAQNQNQEYIAAAKANNNVGKTFSDSLWLNRGLMGWGKNTQAPVLLASALGTYLATNQRNQQIAEAENQAKIERLNHSYAELVLLVETLHQIPTALADVMLNIALTDQLNIEQLRQAQDKIRTTNNARLAGAKRFLEELPQAIQRRDTERRNAQKTAAAAARKKQINKRRRKALIWLPIGVGLAAIAGTQIIKHNPEPGVELGFIAIMPLWRGTMCALKSPSRIKRFTIASACACVLTCLWIGLCIQLHPELDPNPKPQFRDLNPGANNYLNRMVQEAQTHAQQIVDEANKQKMGKDKGGTSNQTR